MALTKIGFTLIKDNFKDAVSGSSSEQSSSFSTRVTDLNLSLSGSTTLIKLETDIPATLTAPNDPVDIAEPLTIPKLPLPITFCQDPLIPAAVKSLSSDVILEAIEDEKSNKLGTVIPAARIAPKDPVDVAEPLMVPELFTVSTDEDTSNDPVTLGVCNLIVSLYLI